MARKRKGFYQYFSAKTGRIVPKGTRGAKRRHVKYGVVKKRIEKRLAKRVEKPTLKGTKRPDFFSYEYRTKSGLLRRVYSIPFSYTSRGLEISKESVLEALLYEGRLDPDVVVFAMVTLEFKDKGEVEFPASSDLLATDSRTPDTLFREIGAAVLGSDKARLLECQLRFEID